MHLDPLLDFAALAIAQEARFALLKKMTGFNHECSAVENCVADLQGEIISVRVADDAARKFVGRTWL